MWEAILGGHESVTKLLAENGATLQNGDVGQYACTAVEQNSLNLLKEIMRHGGDITLPNNSVGTTALHVAVSEDNVEIVKFLVDHGANIDKHDKHGWTPRDLADQQGHVEIKSIFEGNGELKSQSFRTNSDIPMGDPKNKVRYLGRFTSEPTMPSPLDVSYHGTATTDGPSIQNRPRRRSNKFDNSLFGIMSAAHKGESDMLFSNNMNNNEGNSVKSRPCPTRVIVSCPEKGEVAGKLVLLPGSFKELLEIGAKKFGIHPAKVLCKVGAEIDDIEVIRDGDNLVFVSASGMLEANSPTYSNGVLP